MPHSQSRRQLAVYLGLFLVLGNSFWFFQVVDLASYSTTEITFENIEGIDKPSRVRIPVPGLTAKGADALVDTFQHLSAETEDELLDKLHGREFQYRLTCPRETIPEGLVSNATIIVGYHVGMIKNWRLVFQDQLNTLHHCGLGNKLSHLYVTYSHPKEAKNVDILKGMLNRYPFANRTTMKESIGQPIEGAAINMVHANCQKQASPENTVAFYFHTKGTTKHGKDWQKNIAGEWLYGTSLYWRKYMEYFTIERPEICIKAILNDGKYACGVHWVENPFPVFGGNFWSASCKYLNENRPLHITSMTDNKRRWEAEGWIFKPMIAQYGRNARKYASNFYVPSNPPYLGLYRNLIKPEDYDDYSRRWGDKKRIPTRQRKYSVRSHGKKGRAN